MQIIVSLRANDAEAKAVLLMTIFLLINIADRLDVAERYVVRFRGAYFARTMPNLQDGLIEVYVVVALREFFEAKYALLINSLSHPASHEKVRKVNVIRSFTVVSYQPLIHACHMRIRL